MATQKATKTPQHRRLASEVQLGQTANSVLVTGVTSGPDGVRIHYALGHTPDPSEDDPEPAFDRRGQPAHVLDDEADFEAERPADGTRWERDHTAALARLRAHGRINDLES